MNYEFGSSLSFAETMEKIEYFKVLPCFLLSLSEQEFKMCAKFPSSEADVKYELR